MSSTISITLEREVATVCLRARGRPKWELSRPIPKDADVHAVLTELLSSPELGKSRTVDILLDRPPLQKRLIQDLPQVNRRSLARLVAVQAHRLFRDHGALITDATWLHQKDDPVPKAVCVALDTDSADGIARTVHEAGFRLRMLSVGGSCEEQALDLRPPGLRQQQRRAMSAATLRIAGLAALCWVVALGTLAWRVVDDNQRVLRSLKRLEEPRAAVLAARESLDSAAAMVNTIEEAERERWRLANQLVWLSGALPDSAFVTGVELAANGAGRATGWAARPLELQPTLERAAPPGPVRVTQTSARQLSGQRQWEGFELTMGGRR